MILETCQLRSSSAGHCVAALVFAASGEVRYFLARKKLCSTFALMPCGWISRLKKIPRPSNLHTTYLSRYSRRWYSQKLKIKIGSISFRIYKLQNTGFLKKNRNARKCPAAGYLAYKNHTTFKFAHNLPTCRCILNDGIRKKKIHTGSDKLQNSALFWGKI